MNSYEIDRLWEAIDELKVEVREIEQLLQERSEAPPAQDQGTNNV